MQRSRFFSRREMDKRPERLAIFPAGGVREKKTANFRQTLAGIKKMTYICIRNGGLAQLARALAWHARGHEFESRILHQDKAAKRPGTCKPQVYRFFVFGHGGGEGPPELKGRRGRFIPTAGTVGCRNCWMPGLLDAGTVGCRDCWIKRARTSQRCAGPTIRSGYSIYRLTSYDLAVPPDRLHTK